MVHISRILLIGELQELQKALQNSGYEPVMEKDAGRAHSMLMDEWFNLAIIQLPSSDDVEYRNRLNLAMRTDVLVPKIILSSQPLDEMSRTVRDALDSLGKPAPSVAFVSQTEGLQTMIDTVDKAIRKYLGINKELEILPGPEIFRDLVPKLVPEANPDVWSCELEDLFRILFYDSTRIKIKPRHYLSRLRVYTLWVWPTWRTVLDGHPLLVKCGPRENIEEIRENYERFFFRITPTRLAGFARTTHFAAAALPAPSGEYNVDIMDDFPSFYRRNKKNEENIRKAITFFTKTCRQWVESHTNVEALQGKDMRALYLDRLGLTDERKMREVVKDLIRAYPSYGVKVEVKGGEIGFKFARWEKPHFYPNPLSCLYGDERDFELIPNYLSITHGSFHGNNLHVDPEGVIWLDGYENMDWGPAVTDAAALEAILKFRCSEDNWTLVQLYQLERSSLFPRCVTQKPEISEPEEMKRLLEIIAHLREEWKKVLSSTGLKEYYTSLFFFTMKELITEDEDVGHVMSTKRKLYALLSAAMICYRVKNWENFPLKGWPGPKQVAPLRR